MSPKASVEASNAERRVPTALDGYPSYKDSGWNVLRSIPDGWDIIPLKYLSRSPIKSGVGEPGKHTNPEWPRYIRITDIKNPRELHEDTYVSLPPKKASEASLEPGDLLLASAGSVGDSYLCESGIGQACYAGYLVRVAPRRGVDPRYLSYWTESDIYWTEIEQNVIQTTVKNFSATRYQNLHVPLPPPRQQEKISNYLDGVTGRIDQLIMKKERLIELLEEKRTALITQAVTKGLDPDVPMKDSGVEWLGEIPQHWSSAAFGRAFTVQGGYAFSSNDFRSDGVPLVRMSNLKDGSLDFGDAVYVDPDDARDRFALLEGDLLIGMSGSISNFGWVRKENLPCQLNQRVGRIRPRQSNGYLRYALYLLRSTLFTYQIEREAAGTAQVNISSSDIEHLVTPLPPVSEQREIADFLDQNAAQIDQLIQVVRDGVALLDEYCSALITAAVTGKIDVRDHAA